MKAKVELEEVNAKLIDEFKPASPVAKAGEELQV
jgi:hypothetical protein